MAFERGWRIIGLRDKMLAVIVMVSSAVGKDRQVNSNIARILAAEVA